MATLPSATLSINEAAGAPATGSGLCVIMACVAQSADSTPRIMGSVSDLLTQYTYAPGIDYAALHIQKTKKPIMFVGMPITTPGVVTMQDTSGVTGSSLISVAVGSNGAMEECQGVVTVTGGTTVGTDQITLTLSLDGGESTQNVRLGTGTSYAIPYVGLTLSFSAGTLNIGDVFLFTSTAPMWGSTAISAARTGLAAQQQLARTWMVIGDLPSSTFANYVLNEANNYESDNDRFVTARAQVADRSPLPTTSKAVHKTVDASLTFASSGFTITRSSGSFITDGFAVGDVVSCTGSVDNNGILGPITVLSATVMTFASGIANETTSSATLTGSTGFVFAASGHTITRSTGSFVTEGFAVGQSVTISGSVSNNGTVGPISTLSATVMTFSSGLTNETVASGLAQIVESLTLSGWMSNQNAVFASIDASPRINLGAGRARAQSPITGYSFRRPVQWAVSCREYVHDVQIPTYRKADGPLDGFSIADDNGNIVEFDDNIDGGGVEARFTCLRSYSNGPTGAFVALDLTRDTDDKPLSRHQNMNVANVTCTTVQAETENAIGQVLVLNSDGTGTNASLSVIEQRVNSALQINLLQQAAPGAISPEGPRATSATWTASRTAVLNTVGATLPGVAALNLNGTLENINTEVAVQ